MSHIDNMSNVRVFGPLDPSPHPGLPPLCAPLLPPFTQFGQSSSVLFYSLHDDGHRGGGSTLSLTPSRVRTFWIAT